MDIVLKLSSPNISIPRGRYSPKSCTKPDRKGLSSCIQWIFLIYGEEPQYSN